jgi:hypothetical protein
MRTCSLSADENICMCSQKCGLVLKHTQLPIKYIQWAQSSVLQRPEHDANHSFPFSAWQNNEWSSAYTLLYAVMAYTGTTLPVPFNCKWSWEGWVPCVEFSNIPHVSLEQRTVLWWYIASSCYNYVIGNQVYVWAWTKNRTFSVPQRCPGRYAVILLIPFAFMHINSPND